MFIRRFVASNRFCKLFSIFIFCHFKNCNWDWRMILCVMSLKRSSEFLMMLFLWKKCYTGSRVCDVVFVKEMLHRFEVCKFRPDGSRALLSPFINVQLMITRHIFKKKKCSRHILKWEQILMNETNQRKGKPE